MIQGQDSEQGEMQFQASEKISFCSTNTSFQSYFTDYFYVDSERSANNFVRIQLDDQKLLYSQNRHLHVRSLFFNTLEDSCFLRNEKVVYAIKLTDSKSTLTISTYDKNSFVQLYLRLARSCILTGFQKHYRVGKLLGSGTFAEVYDGFNIISHQNVALKVIQKQKIKETEQGFHMLQNQIHILGDLRKYRISPLISTYETVDCFILVLEKGSGGHLFDYIQANASNYGQKMLKCIFKQVLQILSILHHSGIIHRDIKPENIICKGSEAPSIFLCDYSISLKKSEMNPQEDNYAAGTIGYVAPQIVNEQNFDEKCDIFSVGCMFFYLYTGKKLFETKSFERLQTMCEDQHYILKRLECLNHLSFEAKDLLTKMLIFRPKDRVSANEALKHSYFEGSDIFLPNLGENDETLKEFMEKKIRNFWN